MRQSILGCKHRFGIKILMFTLAAIVLSAFMHDHGFGREYDHSPYHHGQIKHGSHTHAEHLPEDRMQELFDPTDTDSPCCIRHGHQGDYHSHNLVTTYQRIRIRTGSLKDSIWVSVQSGVSHFFQRTTSSEIINHFKNILPSHNPYLIFNAADLPPPIF